MKRVLLPSPCFFCCIVLLMMLLSATTVDAQATGSQAESAVAATPLQQERNSATQANTQAAKRIQATESTTGAIRPEKPVAAAPLSLWGKRLPETIRPTQPHRPIPVVLVVLGLLLMLLWSGILIAAILAPVALTVLLVILAIVFSPLFVIGVIFLIGGLIAGLSGSRKSGPAPSNP